MKKIIICMLTLFIVLPSNITSVKVEANELQNTVLRVGTHNLAAPNEDMSKKISQRYDNHGLDIVGVQEADMYNGRNNYDTIKSLETSKLKYSHFAKGRDYNGGDFGIGFLSKYKIIEQSSEPIEHPANSQATKTIERVVIDVDGTPLALYNVHLSWEGLAVRQRQLKQLKERVNNDPISHKIIVGDFNVDQHLHEYSLFNDQFKKANGGEYGWFDTYLEDDDPNMVHHKIDNILVSDNIDIINVGIDPDNSISDHAIFWADIKLNNKKMTIESEDILPGKLLEYSEAPKNGLEKYDIYRITDDEAGVWKSSVNDGDQNIFIDLHGGYNLKNITIDWEVSPESYTISSSTSSGNNEVLYENNVGNVGKDVTSIDIDIVATNININVLSGEKEYAINKISAVGDRVYNMSGENIVPNNDFVATIPEPQEQPPGFEGAHWDTDMWINKIKAEHWIYQKYPKQANTDDFSAEVAVSDRIGSDSNMVIINKESAANSGFFKQMKMPIKGGVQQKIGFWYKHDGISQNNLKLSITEYNSNNDKTDEFLLNDLAMKDPNVWHYYEHTWKTTDNTDRIDLVFRLDNASGSYCLDNVQITEQISKPRNFETARLKIEKNIINVSEQTQITTDYYPISPQEAGINIKYSSEDESIATVTEAGVVQGVSNGETFITLTNSVTDRFHSSIRVSVKRENIPEKPTIPELENLISNGDFKKLEDIPKDPGYYNPKAHHDTDLWVNTEKKPEHWMFQKWRPSEDSKLFRAYLLKEGEENKVEIDLTDKPNSSMGFFKNMKIDIEPNKKYILTADIQKIENEGDFLIRIEKNKGGKLDTYHSGIDEKSRNHYVVFNSDDATSINLILGYEQSSKGRFSIKNVSLMEFDEVPREIKSPKDMLMLKKDENKKIELEFTPTESVKKDVNFIVEDETIATVSSEGIVKGLQSGKTRLEISSKYNPEIKTHLDLIIYDDYIPIEEIEIKNKVENLKLDDIRYLDVKTYPSYATQELNLTWESSNEDVAYFDKNRLITKGIGTTDISVIDSETNLKDSFQLTVNQKNKNDYSMMKEEWRSRFIGSKSVDFTDPDIKKYVNSLNNDAISLFTEMNKSRDREEMENPELWYKVDSTDSAHMTTQFRNLLKLSQAFMLEDSELYQSEEVFNEILSGFDFMIENKKFNGSYWKGNWWDTQIGSSQALSYSILILDNHLTDSQKLKYIKPVKGYNSDVSVQLGGSTSSGANRTDIAISVLASAIIEEDDERMAQISRHVPSVMNNKNRSGDGYYEDGSFVQHSDKAYSGSYGIETIRGLSTIISIIDGTRWQFNESTDYYSNLQDIIPNTYFPIIHKGMNMAMNQGRSITRAPGTNKFSPAFSGGAELSANLLTLADYMPKDLEIKIKEHVKYWYEESLEYYDYIENARDFEMLINMKKLIADEEIKPKIDHGLKVMSGMARVIKQSDNYSAGVSMTSEKISNYEAGNTENPYGFHTGDGMLYLYNDDLNMFGEKYWPTVDWYRLPGITVDTRPLNKNALSGKRSNGVSWVGGVSNGHNGSAGMQLDKAKQNKNGTTFDLKANKSYFFIEDKIVALGSGITGNTNATIETIVENRLLDDKGNNTLKFNDNEVNSPLNTAIKRGDWLYLESQNIGSSIGYYFLEDNEMLTIDKVNKQGTYDDINGYFGSDKIYEADYLLMSIMHGTEVVNDTYGYVILPGLSEATTKKASEDQSIKIIENSNETHAVFDRDTKTFVANVFSDEPIEFDLSSFDLPFTKIKVNNAPSIVIEVTENGEVNMDISSPNKKGKTSEVEIHLNKGEVIRKGDNIQTIVEDDDKIMFEFISNGMAGQSESLTFKPCAEEVIKYLSKKLQTKYDESLDLKEREYTLKSWNELVEAQENAKAVLDNINQSELFRIVTEQKILKTIENLEEAIYNLEISGDLQAAKEFIEEVNNNLEKYTEYSQKQIKKSIDALNVLIENRETQNKLDEQEAQVKEIIEESDISIDIEKYKNTLKKYSEIELSKYTNESVTTFKKAYKMLSEAINDYQPSQPLEITEDELRELTKQLESSYEALEVSELFKLKEELKKELSESKKLNENEYTLSSWSLLRNAQDEAINIINNLETSNVIRSINEKTIQEAIDKLKKAINSLELSGDLLHAQEYVDNVINNIENYTEYSQKEIRNSLLMLNSLIDNRESQNSLDSQFKIIDEIVIKADKKIDIDKYKSKLKSYENLDLTKYTEDSVQAFKSAYEKLSDAIVSYNPKERLIISVEELNKLSNELDRKYDNLVKNQEMKEVVLDERSPTTGVQKEFYNFILICMFGVLALIIAKLKNNVKDPFKTPIN